MSAAEGVSRPKSPYFNQPTHFALSEAINKAVEWLPATDTVTLAKLKDQLFLSPRLKEWVKVVGGIGTEYRITNTKKNVILSVFRERVIMTQGADEITVISDPLSSETLFNNIESAQAIIQSREAETTDEHEDFFDTDSAFNPAAGMDVALEEGHSEPLSEDDAELIEEIASEQGPTETGEEYWNNQAYKDGEPGQIAVEDEVSPNLEDAFRHTEKINKAASSEATQVKKEYKDAPEQDYPKTANTQVISRLKSLQGRLLNIVEASFTDKEQRAAVKTLVNKEFRREMNNFNKGSWNGFSPDED